jgi:mRNA-degrading endonuclease toxin of MazEF toxin-antitoxin module
VGIVFPRGTVIYASQILDPQGRNPKDRPVVLINDFAHGDVAAFGVAISGEYDHPLPPSCIPIPFGRHTRCKTGLKKPSVAVCTWIVAIPLEDLQNRIGIVPPVELLQILTQVQLVLQSQGGGARPLA